MSTSPGDVAKLERRWRIPGGAAIGKCHCRGLEISGTRVRRDSVAARVNVAQVCAGHTFSQSQRLDCIVGKCRDLLWKQKRPNITRVAGRKSLLSDEK
jgi:hypothetical protein